MGLVSVIVPCYNHAHYLGDAVESVLRQTWTAWELIIVDDGSTDDTAQVAATFVDPRIRYLHQPNLGLSAARNAGIAAAAGEYVALLDADDMWMSTFLEHTVVELEANTALAGVYSGFQYVDAHGLEFGFPVLRTVSPEEFHHELVFHGNWLVPCSVVVRAKAYRQTGLFDEGLRACEDFDMWLRISQQWRIGAIAEVLVRYRRAGDNMSANVERMTSARLAVAAKHFGPLDEDYSSWPAEKKAIVTRAFIAETEGYLAQGDLDACARGAIWLLQHRPKLVSSTAFWRRLVYAHQPIGVRGDPRALDRERADADLLAMLGVLRNAGMSARQMAKLEASSTLALAVVAFHGGRCLEAWNRLVGLCRLHPFALMRLETAMLILHLLKDLVWRRCSG